MSYLRGYTEHTFGMMYILPFLLCSSYDEHCRSEKHVTNVELMRKFESTKKDTFLPERKDLLEQLKRCESLRKFQIKETREFIEAIPAAIEKMGSDLDCMQSNVEWKRGIFYMENDCREQMRSLHHEMAKIITAAEKNGKIIERKKQQEETEEEFIEDEQPDEDEIITATDSVREERSKEERRKRKRNRKKKKHI